MREPPSSFASRGIPWLTGGLDRGVWTASLVPSTALFSNAPVDAVRASRATMVVLDRVAQWDCAAWPRGEHYTLLARAAFKGSGSSRATTVGFALAGAGASAPHRQVGSTCGAAGGLLRLWILHRKQEAPPLPPSITRNRSVSCGASAPAAPPGREPLRRRGSLPAPLSPVAPLRGESPSPFSTGHRGRRA